MAYPGYPPQGYPAGFVPNVYASYAAVAPHAHHHHALPYGGAPVSHYGAFPPHHAVYAGYGPPAPAPYAAPAPYGAPPPPSHPGPSSYPMASGASPYVSYAAYPAGYGTPPAAPVQPESAPPAQLQPRVGPDRTSEFGSTQTQQRSSSSDSSRKRSTTAEVTPANSGGSGSDELKADGQTSNTPDITNSGSDPVSASPASGDPGATRVGPKRGLRQLIVNYLDSETTGPELLKLFSQVGKVESARIMYDARTNQPLGYGFIYFHDPDAARDAVACMNGYPLRRKRLKVSFANPVKQTVRRRQRQKLRQESLMAERGDSVDARHHHGDDQDHPLNSHNLDINGGIDALPDAPADDPQDGDSETSSAVAQRISGRNTAGAVREWTASVDEAGHVATLLEHLDLEAAS